MRKVKIKTRDLPRYAQTMELAADKLEQPNGWTKDAYARTASGSDVYPDDPEAVSFCVVGALASVSGAKVIEPAGGTGFLDIESVEGDLLTLWLQHRRRDSITAVKGTWLTVWNDEQENAAVITTHLRALAASLRASYARASWWKKRWF